MNTIIPCHSNIRRRHTEKGVKRRIKSCNKSISSHPLRRHHQRCSCRPNTASGSRRSPRPSASCRPPPPASGTTTETAPSTSARSTRRGGRTASGSTSTRRERWASVYQIVFREFYPAGRFLFSASNVVNSVIEAIFIRALLNLKDGYCSRRSLNLCNSGSARQSLCMGGRTHERKRVQTKGHFPVFS